MRLLLLQLCFSMVSSESYYANYGGYQRKKFNIFNFKTSRTPQGTPPVEERPLQSLPAFSVQAHVSYEGYQAEARVSNKFETKDVELTDILQNSHLTIYSLLDLVRKTKAEKSFRPLRRLTHASTKAHNYEPIVPSSLKSMYQDQLKKSFNDFQAPLVQKQDQKQTMPGNVKLENSVMLTRRSKHKRQLKYRNDKEKHLFFPRYRRSLPQDPPSKTMMDKRADISVYGNVKKESRGNTIYCPQHCSCVHDIDHKIILVDCSNKDLEEIPPLPTSSEKVYLQDNKIGTITCHSFARLTSLIELDLSNNEIDYFANCSFASLISLQYLNLSNCGLDTLPQGIFTSLRSLAQLDLSINNIKNIDGQLFLNLPQLTSLTFYKNSMVKIGNGSFRGLRSLRFLSLQRNLLTYVPNTFEPRAFEGLPSLEILHIQGNQKELTEKFTYPDQALSLLPSLQQLRLDGHPRPLGPGFAPLTNLTLLDFSTESFCMMNEPMPPDFFANLATRQPLYLNLFSCYIETIPPDLFKFLPKIHSLDLSGNEYLGIDGFEKGSEGLRNSTLTTLNISHIVPKDKIALIKNTTFKHLSCTGLKTLIVNGCNLYTFSPGAVSRLPKTTEFISFQDNIIQYGDFLRELILLYNLQTAKLSDQLHYHHGKNPVTDAEILSLKHNTLNSMEKLISPNKSTMKLSIDQDISKNNIAGRKGLFTPFHLKRHDIEKRINSKEVLLSHSNDYICAEMNNGKSEFCGDISTWSMVPLPRHLEFLYASDIKLDTGIPAFHFVNNDVLRHFDVSKNRIKCFGGPITGVPSLQHLDLSQNGCLRMNPFMFSDMPSLTTLLLHHNVLGQSLSDDVNGITFSALYNLTTLDLSVNSIKDLSEQAFTQNPHLRILNLSNNELSHFRPDLSSITRLEILDLSVNTLEDLSEITCSQLVDIKKRNANFTIRIKSNRFLCDCGNFRLFKLLLESPDIFHDEDYFECKLANGSSLNYDQLAQYLPELAMRCVAQTTLTIVSIVFFTMAAMMVISSVYHYKRWQWKYLYYLGKSRLHIGSRVVTCTSAAHTFVTYDQVRVVFSCCLFVQESFIDGERF